MIRKLWRLIKPRDDTPVGFNDSQLTDLKVLRYLNGIGYKGDFYTNRSVDNG